MAASVLVMSCRMEGCCTILRVALASQHGCTLQRKPSSVRRMLPSGKVSLVAQAVRLPCYTVSRQSSSGCSFCRKVIHCAAN